MAEKKDSIRSLIETGRRAGKLTNSEISDAMEESGHVLDVEQMEKLYEELESNGIEVIDDDPVSDVDASLLSGTTEECMVSTHQRLVFSKSMNGLHRGLMTHGRASQCR